MDFTETQEFIESLPENIPAVVKRKLITNPEEWHSSFDIKKLPPIPMAELPSPPKIDLPDEQETVS